MARQSKRLPQHDHTRVVGYCRVSTAAQAESRAGLEAQRTAIEAEAERRGWEIVAVVEDAGVSGALAHGDRAGLSEALAIIERREAGSLVVAKLDRLGRSLLDVAGLMERSRLEGWGLIALDVALDTSTVVGRMIGGVMASVAELERERGRERTIAALAAKRAAGVTLGRPRTVAPLTRARIVELRESGATWQRVADTLALEGHQTGQSGRWQPRTVQRIYDTEKAEQEAAS